jgi:hypothetical protein
MNKIDPKWDTLLESLKEPLRLIILAVITWLIYFIVPQLDQKYAPVILLVLRFADKWVHEYKSTVKSEGTYKGLIGF